MDQGSGEWDAFITYIYFHGGRKPGKRGEGSPSVTGQSSQPLACRFAWKEIKTYSPSAIKLTNAPELPINALMHLQR